VPRPRRNIDGMLISLSQAVESVQVKTENCDAWPVWRHTYGYLPNSRWGSAWTPL